MPDKRGRRGELFIGWPGATGNDLAAGIGLLDAHEQCRGLGKVEWHLRQALREMMRRYQALGGTGAELIGAVLARSVIEGVAEPGPLELAHTGEAQA